MRIRREIKQCCEKMKYPETHHIFVSEGGTFNPPKDSIYYWTGEESRAFDVIIEYCPFCGKKLVLENERKRY